MVIMDSKGRLTKYCFDTSALIGSWRRYYPQSIFPTLWDKLSELIDKDRILLPKEAEKEILNGKDDLSEWLKRHKKCIKQYTMEQLSIVQDIVNKYPKVSQYRKPRPFHADPFVVALAKIEGATVVTFEGNNGSQDNPSIPLLCIEYKVAWCDMIGFFQKEGLSFKHS